MSGVRETAAASLFALAKEAVGSVTSLVTASRRLKNYADVAREQMPALFQVQIAELYEPDGDLLALRKRTMVLHLYLYVADDISSDDAAEVSASTTLNEMVEAIETALKPGPAVRTQTQTLGGACVHAAITGTIEYHEGVTSDGKSVAIIPIEILLP